MSIFVSIGKIEPEKLIEFCSYSCGLCEIETESVFDPELIQLFETFFGSLPGSYKPELFNFQPKLAGPGDSEFIDKDEVIDKDLEGLGNDIFGISQPLCGNRQRSTT